MSFPDLEAVLQYDKCERCGGRYPGFHICVDLSTPEPREPLPNRKGPLGPIGSAAQRLRREREWNENYRRNEEIVAMYAKGQTSSRDIGKIYNMSHSTVLRVLHDAEDQGLIEIRKKGGWTRPTI